jgi:cystathionine beta-lyase/cystathionine gamma-synthase
MLAIMGLRGLQLTDGNPAEIILRENRRQVTISCTSHHHPTCLSPEDARELARQLVDLAQRVERHDESKGETQ